MAGVGRAGQRVTSVQRRTFLVGPQGGRGGGRVPSGGHVARVDRLQAFRVLEDLRELTREPIGLLRGELEMCQRGDGSWDIV